MAKNFEKIYFDENIYCIENFLKEDVVEKVLSMDFEWFQMRNDFHQNIFNAYAPGWDGRDYFKENVEDKIRLAVDNESQKLRSTSLLTKYVPDQGNCLGQACGCQGYDLSWHYENHPGCDYESKWIRWGIVLYFNDDYEGGELVFEHKPVEIKPKRNSLMVFPASEEYSHAVRKVSGNERIVFSGFVYARDYYELLNRSGLIDPLFVFEPQKNNEVYNDPMTRNYFSKRGGPYFVNDGFSSHKEPAQLVEQVSLFHPKVSLFDKIKKLIKLLK